MESCLLVAVCMYEECMKNVPRRGFWKFFPLPFLLFCCFWCGVSFFPPRCPFSVAETVCG